MHFSTGAPDNHFAIQKMEAFDEPGANGLLPIWWQKYKYNANMDPTDLEECSVEKTKTFHDTWTDYLYDTHWNWIKRTEAITPRWFGETWPEVIEREIIYHK